MAEEASLSFALTNEEGTRTMEIARDLASNLDVEGVSYVMAAPKGALAGSGNLFNIDISPGKLVEIVKSLGTAISNAVKKLVGETPKLVIKRGKASLELTGDALRDPVVLERLIREFYEKNP